jgi:hypothetical protein
MYTSGLPCTHILEHPIRVSISLQYNAMSFFPIIKILRHGTNSMSRFTYEGNVSTIYRTNYVWKSNNFKEFFDDALEAISKRCVNEMVENAILRIS